MALEQDTALVFPPPIAQDKISLENKIFCLQDTQLNTALPKLGAYLLKDVLDKQSLPFQAKNFPSSQQSASCPPCCPNLCKDGVADVKTCNPGPDLSARGK